MSGWSNSQKAIMQMYRRYAGLSTEEYGDVLYGVSGQRSSTAPGLSQYQYDRAMPLFEVRAHLAEVNGVAVGTRPRKITDWYYWRNRCPSLGGITSRQLHKIREHWEVCCEFLPKGDRVTAYLIEVAEQATGARHKTLDGMTEGEGRVCIEAVKSLARRLVRQANREDTERIQKKTATARAERLERVERESQVESAAGVQRACESPAAGLQWGPVAGSQTKAKAG